MCRKIRCDRKFCKLLGFWMYLNKSLIEECIERLGSRPRPGRDRQESSDDILTLTVIGSKIVRDGVLFMDMEARILKLAKYYSIYFNL